MLSEYFKDKDTLDDPHHQFALHKLPSCVHWAQCCAIFIPDTLHGADAVYYYQLHRDNFYRQMRKRADQVLSSCTSEDIQKAWSQGKTATILTVENGSVLAGQLERVELLAKDSVRMITLTWNGENEIGSGHTTTKGLSSFGKVAVPELERCGILVDVSHLNDQGFEDVLAVAQKPFVASHSNARQVCRHRRNLTDQQILEMIRRECLIGLNYYTLFLCDDGHPAKLDDLYSHIAHFLELGAQNCLALGSDFDGAEIPPCLNHPQKVAQLYSYLVGRGLPSDLCEKIMWKNAFSFFQTNLN